MVRSRTKATEFSFSLKVISTLEQTMMAYRWR